MELFPTGLSLGPSCTCTLAFAGVLEVVPAVSPVLGAHLLCRNPMAGWGRDLCSGSGICCHRSDVGTPQTILALTCSIPSALAQALWKSKLSLRGAADAFLIVSKGWGTCCTTPQQSWSTGKAWSWAGRKGEGQSCGLKLCCCLKTCHLSQQTLNDVLFWVRSFLCCAG